MAKAELEKAIADLGLVVAAEFVPYSKSRSFKQGAKVNERNLNWHVTLRRDTPTSLGLFILSTDYSAGIGHCPAYQDKQSHVGASGYGGLSIDGAEAVEFETEHGRRYGAIGFLPGRVNVKPILPDPCDVISSLVLDASVLDHSTFESWASDLGYETDRREAEAIYRGCLTIALALRNGVGDAGLRMLQDAAQDY